MNFKSYGPWTKLRYHHIRIPCLQLLIVHGRHQRKPLSFSKWYVIILHFFISQNVLYLNRIKQSLLVPSLHRGKVFKVLIFRTVSLKCTNRCYGRWRYDRCIWLGSWCKLQKWIKAIYIPAELFILFFFIIYVYSPRINTKFIVPTRNIKWRCWLGKVVITRIETKGSGYFFRIILWWSLYIL